jgi:hypothetical protein
VGEAVGVAIADFVADNFLLPVEDDAQ